MIGFDFHPEAETDLRCVLGYLKLVRGAYGTEEDPRDADLSSTVTFKALRTAGVSILKRL